MTWLFLLMYPVLWQAETPQSLAYLGQKAPGETAKVFAPGLVSKKDESEFGSVFNKAGTELFYGVGLSKRTEIRMTQVVDGKWTTAVPLVAHPVYNFMDPSLSLDGKRLYFITNRPSNGMGPKTKTYNINFVERQASGWSDPKPVGAPINTDRHEFYISFSTDGSMYYASNFDKKDADSENFDIFVSAWRDQAFQKPVRVSSAINSGSYEGDAFVAPDESYLIFCSGRPEGLGNGDLYISFKGEDGQWTKAVNMGDKINTPKQDYCPFVSRDGKYFFYSTNKDIYWVNASILETYR